MLVWPRFLKRDETKYEQASSREMVEGLRRKVVPLSQG